MPIVRQLSSFALCHWLYVPVPQYDLNLAGSALDYVGGNADRLSDPLVSPLLAEYGRGHDAPPTLIQVRTKGLNGDRQSLPVKLDKRSGTV